MNSEEHIVFVHIPKTAGTSLKESLTSRFDKTQILFDYQKPLKKYPSIRKIECLISSFRTRHIEQRIVFGHFLAGKYANFSKLEFGKRPDWKYITFFRDPLQRAISHYYFWKRTYDGEHPLWRKLTAENMPLEQFLFSRELKNFHSQFLWRFPISNFDFIGIAEHFDESMRMLGRTSRLFEGLSSRADNINPVKESGDRYVIDLEIAAEFKKYNAEDYRIYNQALIIFNRQRERFIFDGNS